MPWQRGQVFAHRTKNELALEMIQWALAQGFPKATVLADSWFCVDAFVRGLRKLRLAYVLELKSSNLLQVPCKTPKLTPTGRLAKHQVDLVHLSEFFAGLSAFVRCGFERDLETGKAAKVLYQAKVTTVRLNALPGKHRVVQSTEVTSDTVKYFLTNQLHWEAVRILAAYANRWAVEEFFRNAKQLSDMEGATIRSEQGVTLALCLVSWLDFLLHHQNVQRTAEGSQPESLSIPSIVRQAQADNLQAFLEKIQTDEDFVQHWVGLTQEQIRRPRKASYPLVDLDAVEDCALPMAV
jgi:hypothetical protein